MEDIKPIRHPIPESLCPECGALPVSSCRCPASHSTCANGHKYFLTSKSRKEVINGRLHTLETWWVWQLE